MHSSIYNFSFLRQQAERKLSTGYSADAAIDVSSLTLDDAKRIVEELQIYQVE